MEKYLLYRKKINVKLSKSKKTFRGEISAWSQHISRLTGRYRTFARMR